MHRKDQFRTFIFHTVSRTLTLVLAIVLALVLLFTHSAQAQTYTVIHNFTGGVDGGDPQAGLTADNLGNLYGTTSHSTTAPCGTVFSLAKRNSSWILNTLLTLEGDDGCGPYAPVTIGPDGTLYGTTYTGGTGGSGTVFNVRPSAVACRTTSCSWLATVIYSFTGRSDGASPAYGGLIFDQAGNIYGTTHLGGYTGGNCAVDGGCGTVFQLMSNLQGNWMENTLHIFMGKPDGSDPSRVLLGGGGNLYGITAGGGAGTPTASGYPYGTVFQLTPSGNEWTEKILHNFTNGSDGGSPWAGPVFDQAGNLYGVATEGGAYGFGTLFELSSSINGWSFSAPYSFTDGTPIGLVMDATGSMYGNAMGGAYNCGFVFKLTPLDGGWAFTNLHDFAGSDGCIPRGSPALDAGGNLYGLTQEGGTGLACDYGCGVAWEITR